MNECTMALADVPSACLLLAVLNWTSDSLSSISSLWGCYWPCFLRVCIGYESVSLVCHFNSAGTLQPLIFSLYVPTISLDILLVQDINFS